MTVEVLVGDVIDKLKDLSDESVHMVVTSPPYYNLRDYGTASWKGGDPDCDHVSHEIETGKGLDAASKKYGGGGSKWASTPKQIQFTGECKKCGAKRVDNQIGLEETPEQFVQKMVEVFREVRRVLRKDGTCWINIGDSYVSSPPGNKEAPKDEDGAYKRRMDRQLGHGEDRKRIYKPPKGLKQKEVVGIPWMLAFALRADGWLLRQDIIWHKPSALPESTRDRCTKAHEYIFLLTKGPNYFFDQDAIREDPKPWSQGKVAAAGTSPDRMTHGTRNAMVERKYEVIKGANRRSVWTIGTESNEYKEEHYAAFPTMLPTLCIKAGTSKYVCSECGAPFVRDHERIKAGMIPYKKSKYGKAKGMAANRAKDFHGAGIVMKGWSPSCKCKNCEPVPATVLDPFFGSGTTGVVADKLGRNCIGIDLNPKYAAMAERRVRRQHSAWSKY